MFELDFVGRHSFWGSVEGGCCVCLSVWVEGPCVCVCQQADAEACSVVCHEKGVCVLPVVSLSVSTGSGMDVCMRGWVGGFFGKRY